MPTEAFLAHCVKSCSATVCTTPDGSACKIDAALSRMDMEFAADAYKCITHTQVFVWSPMATSLANMLLSNRVWTAAGSRAVIVGVSVAGQEATEMDNASP